MLLMQTAAAVVANYLATTSGLDGLSALRLLLLPRAQRYTRPSWALHTDSDVAAIPPAHCAGLDGHSALSVMTIVSKAALCGHAVIASIHQPRAAVWSLFTQVRTCVANLPPLLVCSAHVLTGVQVHVHV